MALRWNKGPFMNNAKMNAVNISNWPRTETIMPHGPIEATNKLNERFRMTMGDETKQEENANATQQGRGGPEKTNKKPRVGQRDNHKDEENSATPTRNQIGDLLLLVRCWENQQHLTDANTCAMNQDNPHPMDQQLNDEEAQTARGRDAIRNIKRDIAQYLRTRGFISGKGRGKGKGAWGRYARM